MTDEEWDGRAQIAHRAVRAAWGLLAVGFLVAWVGGVQGAPANDRFSNRITLAGADVTVTGTSEGATKEAGEPNHAGNPGGSSVWWSWTAPANGDVVIRTDGSTNTWDDAFDTLLGVYVGTIVSSLSLVATNDDHGPFVTSRVRFYALQGTQYQIAVDGYNDGTGAEEGSIRLSLSFLAEPIVRPANDNFANREVVAGAEFSVKASNVHASREQGEPRHAGKGGDTSVWWSWTATQSGRATLSTVGSTFDTLLAVYRGTALSSLVPVASNDDIDPDRILVSEVTFDVVGGQTYIIAVDGYDGASGLVQLNLEIARTRLNLPRRSADGSFRFVLSGPAGLRHDIEATDDMARWFVVGNVTNSTGNVLFTDRTATNSVHRCYRSVVR